MVRGVYQRQRSDTPAGLLTHHFLSVFGRFLSRMETEQEDIHVPVTIATHQRPCDDKRKTLGDRRQQAGRASVEHEAIVRRASLNQRESGLASNDRDLPAELRDGMTIFLPTEAMNVDLLLFERQWRQFNTVDLESMVLESHAKSTRYPAPRSRHSESLGNLSSKTISIALRCSWPTAHMGFLLARQRRRRMWLAPTSYVPRLPAATPFPD